MGGGMFMRRYKLLKKYAKPAVSAALALIVCLSILQTAVFSAGIGVVLDGESLELETQPVMIDDRVLVPMRAVFEAMGATVIWHGDVGSVEAVKGDISMMIGIDMKYMIVNKKQIQLDVPARLIGDYTMIPIRAVSEVFGCNVDWDESSQTVYIETSEYLDSISLTNTEGAASGSASSSGLADSGLEYESYLNKSVNGYALYPDVPNFGDIMDASAAAVLDGGKNITYDAESIPEFSDEVYKYYMLKNGFDFIAQNGYDMYIKGDLTVLAGFYDDVFRVLIVEE